MIPNYTEHDECKKGHRVEPVNGCLDCHKYQGEWNGW